MIDITDKITTLRIAKATVTVKVSRKSIAAVKNKTVPKGDVFSFAEAAGMMAVKNTGSALPHCHPIPVEYADFDFKIKNNNCIIINVEVRTVYKTGCEMEALYGASVSALTVYDMLKPIDKEIIIEDIFLTYKSGGKSDTKPENIKGLKAAVITVSDSVFKKKAEDISGKLICDRLKSYGIKVKKPFVVSDEPSLIRKKIESELKNKTDLIISTGGTGASKRDITLETVKEIIDKEIPGIMESARNYSQSKMPYSMFSAGTAGFKGDTLILTFPGSPSGVKDYLNVLLPYVFHLFDVRKGKRH
ncbi:MAG: bifunctional molybdenum cofactor biosynthesis protein MoaC/MoaB [Bacteroidetes bacterium]|nr:bifunctional molybdenum cofactor biosynthesis protein MoaC/MoaB [Bacteroidota bacterium]